MAAAPARCLWTGQPWPPLRSSAAKCWADDNHQHLASATLASTSRRHTPCLPVPGSNLGRRSGFLLLSAVSLLLSFAGCRTGAELVEAELRRTERENEQLSQKLRDCECEVRVLEAEYERLLSELRTTGKVELRGLVYLKGITLGRLTGGLDDDPDCPGDDALVVVLEPRDLDDQVVKVPGHVHVDVYEISPQGLKQPLSSWHIPARELRGKWETPLLGSPAYRLTLRWKVIPHYDRLRIIVRFTTLDGQMFETDRDVTIRPPRRESDRCRSLPSEATYCPPRQAKPSPAWIGTPHRGVQPHSFVPAAPAAPGTNPSAGARAWPIPGSATPMTNASSPSRPSVDSLDFPLIPPRAGQNNKALPTPQDASAPQDLPPPPPGPILIPMN